MAHKALPATFEQPTQLSRHEEIKNQPKLTMKFLYERINKLQQENERLSQLVADLERQWNGVNKFRLETAAGLEEEQELSLSVVRLEYRHEAPQDNHRSRTERHAKKMKKKPAFFQNIRKYMLW